MAKKHYEENFKKQIIKTFNQGNHIYKELSEQYGIAASTMRQWLNTRFIRVLVTKLKLLIL